MEKNWRKKIFSALKIIISIGLLYFIFNKIDWNLLIEEWKSANKIFLVLAFISFIISQIFSVLRIDLFFKKSDVHLSFLNNARLYLLGMFYNFFIPGGVGGDVYKVYALHKAYKQSIKSLTSAVFFDRLMGLCAICVLICINLVAFFLPFQFYIKGLLLLLIVVGIMIGIRILRYLHPKFKSIYYPSFLYSLVIQGFQIGTIVLTLWATQPSDEVIPHIVIFLISSILSIVSFAGIGIRETFFYYAAEYFKFNPDVSAGIALNFSIITLITSLFGMVYLFKKIEFHKS